MKRIGNLYDKICSVENIKLAERRARRHKDGTYGVRIFDRDYDGNILRIHRMLSERTYRTSEYKVKTIHDPKEREIFILPYFPDRVIHHAIMNVLEPIWNTLFIQDTYSCIKGRGTFLCAERTVKALHSYNAAETVYCLKMDVQKFYPSIDHDILKEIIRKKIKCQRTLSLLDEIIDSAPGVPIGNYLSQFFANIYLTYFDHWMKEDLKVKNYFRYADDMVVLSTDKEYLRDILGRVKEYLETNLKLRLKGNEQIFPVAEKKEKTMYARAIDFVGLCIYRKELRIRKRIKQNFARKMKKVNVKAYRNANEYKAEFSSWLGWCKYSDSVHLAKKLVKPEYFKDVEETVKYNYRKKFYHNGKYRSET